MKRKQVLSDLSKAVSNILISSFLTGLISCIFIVAMIVSADFVLTIILCILSFAFLILVLWNVLRAAKYIEELA